MLKKIILSIGIFFWIASISVASDKPTKLVPTDGNMRPVAVQYLQEDDGTYSKVNSGSPLPVSGSFSLTGMADIGDISKGTQTNDVKVTLDGEAVTETNSGSIKTAVEALDTSALLTEVIFTGRIGEVQATPTANTLLSRLKVIADNQLADGHNVTVDNVSLAVTGTFWQTTQPVSGTFWQTTQPISGNVSTAMTIVRKESSQDLSSAVLSYTTNFAAKTRVKSIMLHASGNITETVTFTFDSKTGVNYDTTLASESLTAEANLLYIPDSDLILESGDELHLACSNNGTSNIVYVTVLAETIN